MATTKSAAELKQEEIEFYTRRVAQAQTYLDALESRARKTPRINFARIRLAEEQAALEAARGLES